MHLAPRRVTAQELPGSPMLPVRAALTVFTVVTMSAVMGCSGGGTSSSPSSGPASAAQTGGGPSGIGGAGTTPSAATTKPPALALGQPAAVPFRTGASIHTTLQVVPNAVTRGDIADLSNFQVPAEHKTSTPFYVTVVVRNTGRAADADTGSTDPAAGLRTIDTRGIPRTPVNLPLGTPFPRCPRLLPVGHFSAGQELRTCLTYLLPAGMSPVTLEWVTDTGAQAAEWSVPSVAASAVPSTPAVRPTSR